MGLAFRYASRRIQSKTQPSSQHRLKPLDLALFGSLRKQWKRRLWAFQACLGCWYISSYINYLALPSRFYHSLEPERRFTMRSYNNLTLALFLLTAAIAAIAAAQHPLSLANNQGCDAFPSNSNCTQCIKECGRSIGICAVTCTWTPSACKVRWPSSIKDSID